MKVSYYPGCSLHATAREFDESTKSVTGALGIDLEELPDWNCCGASSAHATDEALARGLAMRNLAIAERQGMDLVVPCAACYSRSRPQKSGPPMRRPARQGRSACSASSISSPPPVSSNRWPASVKRPLTGLKVVSYYGCL